jgi:hypothetical protein
VVDQIGRSVDSASLTAAQERLIRQQANAGIDTARSIACIQKAEGVRVISCGFQKTSIISSFAAEETASRQKRSLKNYLQSLIVRLERGVEKKVKDASLTIMHDLFQIEHCVFFSFGSKLLTHVRSFYA